MNIDFIDAKGCDIDNIINMLRSDPSSLENTPFNLDKNEEPWAWISDSSLTFMVALTDKKICGFFIARHIGKNTHLHALYVKELYRNKGLGKILLLEFWIRALKLNPNIETFTLHVYSKNTNAIRFYLKNGFREIRQKYSLIFDAGGFGSWAKNCSEKGQWPLKNNQLLLGVELKKIVTMVGSDSNIEIL